MLALSASLPPKSISCVVCAYNEGEKITNILRAIQGHPLLSEIIVVDDGSSDNTAELARSFADVRLISYSPNRGKTYALSQGMAAASGDYLMLLDADLDGVTAADIYDLADPVMRGHAQITISMRANSLSIYRAIGLDFVSGERMLPAWLIAPHLKTMETLPRWGGEVFMNDLITRNNLSLCVVKWKQVFNIRKAQKVGLWRGILAELSMMADVMRVLSPVRVVSQNLAMMRLAARTRARLSVRTWLAAPQFSALKARLAGGRLGAYFKNFE